MLWPVNVGWGRRDSVMPPLDVMTLIWRQPHVGRGCETSLDWQLHRPKTYIMHLNTTNDLSSAS